MDAGPKRSEDNNKTTSYVRVVRVEQVCPGRFSDAREVVDEVGRVAPANVRVAVTKHDKLTKAQRYVGVLAGKHLPPRSLYIRTSAMHIFERHLLHTVQEPRTAYHLVVTRCSARNEAGGHL